MGNIGKVGRIVNRQAMKAELARLKLIIKTHQPLIESMKVTQKAFDQGVLAGEKKGFEEGIQQGFKAGQEAHEATYDQPTKSEGAGIIDKPVNEDLKKAMEGSAYILSEPVIDRMEELGGYCCF
jgi:flagellar biosynthesis/type III secretory pathway protein FliH